MMLLKFFAMITDISIVIAFSAPRIPQQNRVFERKNKSLQEMARTILLEFSMPNTFFSRSPYIGCYIQIRVFTHPFHKLTPFESWCDEKPKVDYFHVFGSTCYVLIPKIAFV